MLQGFFTNKLMFFEKTFFCLKKVYLHDYITIYVCKCVTEEEHADAEQPGVVDERAGSEADAAHRRADHDRDARSSEVVKHRT